jgi:AcrR family transcriptional regulator
MYRVAQRAGVGQATLYRHFPERGLLAVAVYEQRLDHLEKLAAEHAGDPQAFLMLIRQLIEEDTHTPGLLGVLREQPDSERYYRHLTARALDLLVQPLHVAKSAGVVRADFQLRDIQLIFAMFQGVAREADAYGRPQLRVRALELLVQGLALPSKV